MNKYSICSKQIHWRLSNCSIKILPSQPMAMIKESINRILFSKSQQSLMATIKPKSWAKAVSTEYCLSNLVAARMPHWHLSLFVNGPAEEQYHSRGGVDIHSHKTCIPLFVQPFGLLPRGKTCALPLNLPCVLVLPPEPGSLVFGLPPWFPLMLTPSRALSTW